MRVRREDGEGGRGEGDERAMAESPEKQQKMGYNVVCGGYASKMAMREIASLR